MNDLMDPRAGPGSLESLLDALDGLREQFKLAVARLVGGSFGRAVAGLMRMLLGAGPDAGPQEGDWDEEDGDRFYGPHRAAEPPEWLARLATGMRTALAWLGPLVVWAGTLIC